MSLVTGNQPEGTPTWIDLGIPDLDGAITFYESLFGWEFAVGPEEYGRYTTVCSTAVEWRRSRPTATPLQPRSGGTCTSRHPTATQLRRGSAQRIRAAGGTILSEPMDVMDQGRMAIAQDPVGAPFGLWQGRKHIGCEAVNEPGALVRYDLVTPDPEPARAF